MMNNIIHYATNDYILTMDPATTTRRQQQQLYKTYVMNYIIHYATNNYILTDGRQPL